MRLTWILTSALAVVFVACQPTRAPATPQAPAGAPASAAAGAAHQPSSASPHSAEVLRLLQAARDAGETELNVSWSGSSLGGFDGIKRFEALFNQMYGTNIKVNFTPGPSMTDMAGKVAQEVAAERKASTDILLGSEQHYGSLLGRDVLEEYDYTLLQPRITKDLVAARNMAVEFYSTIPGIIFNTEFVAPAEAPKTLEEVFDAKWRGKIASTQNAAYFDRVAMRAEWGPERMKAYVARLSQHIGGLIRVGDESRIISGEYLMMVMGNTHSVREYRAKGVPMAYTIPENAANVGFLHLGVPRNSSHPNLGKLFINMIVTEPGQRLLYDVYFVDHYALPGSQTGAELQELKARGLQVLDIDVQFVAEHPEMRELTGDLERLLREGRGG
jgi:ABC-type Fe3+ transport system substrate-binding protein